MEAISAGDGFEPARAIEKARNAKHENMEPPGGSANRQQGVLRRVWFLSWSSWFLALVRGSLGPGISDLAADCAVRGGQETRFPDKKS